MKEITGNLKRDMRELLGESAHLFTGFFKRGACTVRAVADKWKSFARDISSAVDELMKPPFLEGGPEAPAPLLSPELEPIVTVVESTDERFPVKLQMPLSQAERHIREVNRQYRKDDPEHQTVKVKIDYMKDGQTDRYFLPLKIGAAGSLLEQMREHVDSFRTDREKVSQLFHELPEEYRESAKEELTPFLDESLSNLSSSVLRYFQHHYDISELERHLKMQAAQMPEKMQSAFLNAQKEVVDNLRQSANAGITPEPIPTKERASCVAEPPRPAETERPRQSVKVKLRQVKKDHAGQKIPSKLHAGPQR